MEAGFDNSLYIHKQTEHIRQRIAQWGGKLYLEFGGKLFDDYHAARVLPGFDPNGKIRLLYEMREQAEIIFTVSAGDIEKTKCARTSASAMIWRCCVSSTTSRTWASA